jgi:hypothetical protein
MKVKTIQCESGRVSYECTKGGVITTTKNSLRLIGRDDNTRNNQLWSIDEEGKMYLLEQGRSRTRISFWLIGSAFKVSVST